MRKVYVRRRSIALAVLACLFAGALLLNVDIYFEHYGVRAFVSDIPMLEPLYLEVDLMPANIGASIMRDDSAVVWVGNPDLP